MPGSGKSSTIHALASELGLPIFALSLGSNGLDDSRLHGLLAATPTKCILTLEDLDCAFPATRHTALGADPSISNQQEDGSQQTKPPSPNPRLKLISQQTGVTFSGLLNAIDSIWSDEGRIVIATVSGTDHTGATLLLIYAQTNHINRLDPALLRPGRLDLKIEYRKTTRDQAEQMFTRFYPPHRIRQYSGSGDLPPELDEAALKDLAVEFGNAVPESMFSAAELQGYLLQWKNNPKGARQGVSAFVAS